jgi:hypothetical protein
VIGAGVTVAQVVPQPPGQSPSQKKISSAAQSGGVHIRTGVSPLSGGRLTGAVGVGFWLPGMKRQAADRNKVVSSNKYLDPVHMLHSLLPLIIMKVGGCYQSGQGKDRTIAYTC